MYERKDEDDIFFVFHSLLHRFWNYRCNSLFVRFLWLKMNTR